MGEFFRGLALDSVFQILISAEPRAGNRLIGGIDDALDLIEVVQRLEGYHGLDGGAVGVGDDALVPIDILRVYFGNDQRNGFIHAPCAGIIDDNSSRLCRHWSKFQASVAARAEQGNVNVFSIKAGFRQFLHDIIPAKKCNLFSGAPLGGEEIIVFHGQLALLQNLKELAPYHAGCTNDCNVILFHYFLRNS